MLLKSNNRKQSMWTSLPQFKSPQLSFGCLFQHFPLSGTNKAWATPRLVSFRVLFLIFRRASPSLSYGSPPSLGAFWTEIGWTTSSLSFRSGKVEQKRAGERTQESPSAWRHDARVMPLRPRAGGWVEKIAHFGLKTVRKPPLPYILRRTTRLCTTTLAVWFRQGWL